VSRTVLHTLRDSEKGIQLQGMCGTAGPARHSWPFPEADDVKCEQTLLMIKPDGVRRCLVGNVITRIEQKGLTISGMRMFHMDEDFASSFYAEHTGQDYFHSLIAFMTSGPVVALQIEAPDAVSIVRATIGATCPEDRLPGTIRADYSCQLAENVVHASSSASDAERELALIFGDSKRVYPSKT
jgi:nucleoside-diphosphate kinase